MKKIKSICAGLATCKKVRGKNRAVISFFKNWGHGKLGGDRSQGVLGQLAAAGFDVINGSYGNVYSIALPPGGERKI